MTWSERFAAYLKKHGIDRLRAAYELETSTSTIHYWIHGATPHEKKRKRVQAWSKGEVSAEIVDETKKRNGTTG